jgi:hypothetical protein
MKEVPLTARTWRTEYVGPMAGNGDNGMAEDSLEVVMVARRLLTDLPANLPTTEATGWSQLPRSVG